MPHKTCLKDYGLRPFLCIFLFLLLFFFTHFSIIEVIYLFFDWPVLKTWLWCFNDSFGLPETSGSRLCSGATCQEYFRLSGHY